MSCPFPGVDPFLEPAGLWPDFHDTFLIFWRQAIARIIPQHYEVRVNERVQIVSPAAERIPVVLPDVAVLRGPVPRETPPALEARALEARDLEARATSAVLAPLLVPLAYVEQPRETYLQILHRPDRRLVTVLELLSPSNKVNPGLEAHLAKRAEFLAQDVHLLELDLLRAGQRLPLSVPYPRGDFHALLARADRREWLEVYSWTVRDPLPALPIPLLPPDPDLVIDLQAIFSEAYDSGQFERGRNDALPLPAAWDEASQTWIRAQVRDPGPS